MRVLSLVLAAELATSCTNVHAPGAGQASAPAAQPNAYFDNTGRQDVLAGGVRMVSTLLATALFQFG